MKRICLAAAAASLACALWTCTQGEGDRCQRDDDCAPLLCVGADGNGESGHCCPSCSSGAEYWDAEEMECTCNSTRPATDGDADDDDQGEGQDGGADGGEQGDAEAGDGGAGDGDMEASPEDGGPE